MSKNQIVYLQDILDSIEHIFAFTDSNDWDEKTRYAVERALTIIGEAGNKVSLEIKQNSPEIAWNEIKGLRNILVHEYGKVNIAILKDIRDNYIVELQEKIDRLIKKLEGIKNAD